MASYDKIAAIDRELTQMRQKKIDLFKRREILMLDEAVRMAEADRPSAADQIAAALIAVHTQNAIPPPLSDLFWMQSPEVNTAGLLQMAEWRDPETIEMFLLNGADVVAKNKAGFSVLEMVIQGHDGYWRGDSPHWNKAVFDVLAKYVNLDYQVVKPWIIDQCCDGAPKYVRDFLGLDV